MARYWRDESVTAAEHHALKSEFWVMALLLAIGILCVAAEPIMDWLEMLVMR
jgi:hypothetical protein